MLMIYFAHDNHKHAETVQATTAQADSPDYAIYVAAAVGLSLLVIGVVLLANSFKKKITS
jgi:hypothetical protein